MVNEPSVFEPSKFYCIYIPSLKILADSRENSDKKYHGKSEKRTNKGNDISNNCDSQSRSKTAFSLNALKSMMKLAS